MSVVMDDWWEFLIAGIILLSALGIIYATIKVFFSKGGKIKVKGTEVMGSEPECAEYVKEHTQLLVDLQKKVDDMETNYEKYSKESCEANKVTQTFIKTILISLDALMEAFQANHIGNGNLEKARKLASQCAESQDSYLIAQL
jgi:hypothetical protein